ncbi:MAG: hypothetical protein KC944_03410 [Candidatus Omnitrophica bacterium]|nr:hypothetical protein [Candidatus Omnitrophota bacterium]
MINRNRPDIKRFFVCLGVFGFMAIPAFADGDWGFYLNPGGAGFSYHDDDSHIRIDTAPRQYYRPAPVYTAPPPVQYYPSYNYSYYPRYNPNPVVRRDVVDRGYYAPDGTYHSDTTVEDRRASYYSPGRNQAVTRPQTTVTRTYGPDGTWREQEHTSWIGADGRPHSTTVDKVTSQDIWGNTHTDSHVTLKSKNSEAGGDSKTQPEGKAPVKSPPPLKKQ